MAILSKKILKISVVIPSFTRYKLAYDLAQKVKELCPEAEVILADQCNSDPPEGQALLKKGIYYLNLPRCNTSYAKNEGLKQAKGDIVLFFDDDVSIYKNTISAHVAAYQKYPSLAGVAGRVINPEDTVPTNADVPTGHMNHYGTSFEMRFWSTKEQYVDFPYGCNMSFRRDYLLESEGFDANYDIPSFEEIDLAMRIKKRGNILFVPDALVHHNKDPQGRPNTTKKENIMYFAYGRFIARNIPFPVKILSYLWITIRSMMMSIRFGYQFTRGFLSGL